MEAAATATKADFNYERPYLYEKQRAFVDCPARYTVVEASTKAGKTIANLIWIFERSLAGNPGHNFWWIAPVYRQAEMAYLRLKQMIQRSEFPKRYFRSKDTTLSLYIAERCIQFLSAERPDNLYGEDVYAAVVDEASRCREAAWHALRSTLTATQGPVKIIGNVRGRKNWAYRIARRAEQGAENHAFFRLTALDAVEAGVFPIEEFNDAKAVLPESVFKELYLAEPSEDGGNPFGAKHIDACLIPELSANDPVCFGVDLGKHLDYTVIIGLDQANAVCRYQRFQCDWGMTKHRILEAVGSKPTLVDSTGVGDPIVEDLRAVRGNIRGFLFTNRSKQQLMEGLASAIQNKAIFFPDTTDDNGIELAAELREFEYNTTERGSVTYSAPDGFHDDCVAACGLALAQRKAFIPLDFESSGSVATRRSA